MNLIAFTDEPEHVEQFLSLPCRLHADNPNYIPPLTRQMRNRFDRQHSFYRYGSIKNFLLLSEGDVLGRISAMENPRSSFASGTAGFIGYFDCVQDRDVARRLIEAALGYLDEKGHRQVFAPVNFSTWYEYRFMVDGHDREPFPFEPYNPPYYPEFFKELGFDEASSYRSAIVENPNTFLERSKRLVENYHQSGYSVRPMGMRKMIDYELLYDLTVEIFRHNYGFSHIEKREFMDLHAKTRMGVSRNNILFAQDPQKRPIGFIVTIPNYYAAVQALQGEINVGSALRFVKERKKADTLVVKTLGVLPGLRRVVPGHVLLAHAYQYAIDSGYTRIIHALMREGNPSMKIDKSADTSFKRYALFSKSLESR